MRQSQAALDHDAREAGIGAGPDAHHLRPARPGDLHPFRDPTRGSADRTELVVFEDCAHAPIYEKVEAFNERTLGFLHRHSG